MTVDSVPPPAPPAPPVPPQRDLLTSGMIESLRATKPWVRFLSILGFIGAALMMLTAVGVAVAGALQLSQGSDEGALLIGLGLLYLLFGVLYIFPSRYLFRYASAIEEALTARFRVSAVERALREQKSFWKFAGIMALITVLLYIPGVMAAIAIPNLLTAMQRSRQKRTMADLQSVARSIEIYATDHNQYPNVDSFEKLPALLEPKYAPSLPRVDGWGHPFVYEPARCEGGACTAYYVASTGKDGKLERAPSEHGETYTMTASFDDDIVYFNGAFIRGPEGSERR